MTCTGSYRSLSRKRSVCTFTTPERIGRPPRSMVNVPPEAVRMVSITVSYVAGIMANQHSVSSPTVNRAAEKSTVSRSVVSAPGVMDQVPASSSMAR